jgi:hypothetical protein
MTRSWYTAWASSYLPMDRWIGPMSWLVARGGAGDILAIIPLACQRWPGFTVTSLAGYYWPFRAIPIVPDQEGLRDTCSAIAAFVSSRREFRTLRLGPVPRTDPAVRGLVNAFDERGWVAIEKSIDDTYAILMPPDFKSYERELGSHLLKKVAYFERRLRKTGDVEIRAGGAASATEWLGLLDDLSSVEGKSWVKEKEGTLKFVGERNRRFWQEAISSEAVARALRVWLLYVEGKPVSYSLNIDSGSTRYILANGYDAAFKEHSTGSILAYHLLRDASQRGMSTVEWGLGDSGYKTRWLARPHFELVDVMLIPGTMLGRLQAALLTKKGGYRYCGAL